MQYDPAFPALPTAMATLYLAVLVYCPYSVLCPYFLESLGTPFARKDCSGFLGVADLKNSCNGF